MAKRILIADDAAFMRMMLKDILTKGGYEIAGEAADGNEALSKYKELKPDLVTMDITMPVMDGLEALQVMKKDDENAKVVMITALGQKDKMIQAIKNGAAEFITKPFEDEEVVKAINKVLGK